MMKYSRIILAISLLILIYRYVTVLLAGYDTFEGINDPAPDWINYVTYGAAGFVVAAHRSLKWGGLVGAILASVCVAIRWSLIIGAWVATPRGPDFIGWLGQYWPQWILTDLVVGLIAGAACGLAGAWLSQRSMRFGKPTQTSEQIPPELGNGA